MSSHLVNETNIIIITIMIVAAIGFSIGGAYIVKNEEETQIILQDSSWEIIEPTSTVNYTLSSRHPFQFHEIHVKERGDAGANNTRVIGDDYSGIYAQAYDENYHSLQTIPSEYMVSFICETRNFSIFITQMSQFLYSYEVELHSYYQDATANLWYLFSGFLGTWAIGIVLIFVFKKQKIELKEDNKSNKIAENEME